MKKFIKISKLDAAKRQFETAIRLYFYNSDPVSIHTLTSAAYNIIRDLNTNLGGELTTYKDRFIELVKPGHEKEVIRIINKAENFFKHAERDHNGIINFNPDQSEFVIYEGCAIYCRITGEYPILFKAYHLWFTANNEEHFIFTEEDKAKFNISKSYVVAMGREKYFSEVLPLLMRMSV